MSHFLVSLGWVLLFVAVLLVIGGWELEAFVTASGAGVAFFVAYKLEMRSTRSP